MYAVEGHIRFYFVGLQDGRIHYPCWVRPTEPLLAEAAYEFLNNGTLSSPAHRLANHSDLNCVNRGQRGELVATLLTTIYKRATPHNRQQQMGIR